MHWCRNGDIHLRDIVRVNQSGCTHQSISEHFHVMFAGLGERDFSPASMFVAGDPVCVAVADEDEASRGGCHGGWLGEK